MSKLSLHLVFVIISTLTGMARAQVTIDADVVITGQTATVSGRYQKPAISLRFLNSYAGVSGLASRISRVHVRDIAGGTPDVMPSAADRSEYLDIGPFLTFGYTISLVPAPNRMAAAHTSWIGENYGLIMLDDLLPQSGDVRSGTVRLKLPDGWSIAGAELKGAADEIRFSDADKTAFLISRDRRDKHSGQVALGIVGRWQFTDEDAAKAADEVGTFYSRLFGPPPRGGRVNLLRFPTEAPPGEWEADTRGSTVTILSSDAPFKSQSLNRLHEQLRHEIFHLWFPNGVNLSGNYDWFYEGFALYQSLKLGVAVNRIRFDDYLDVLSRAYAMDSFGSKRVSLIESSKSRFVGSNNTAVYARGMLVAFLCDLAMMDASKGKRSTDDLVREIYQKHPLSSARADGNDGILAIMKQRPELAAVADKYVTAADAIDWAALLNTAGLEFTQSGREKALKVVAKPSGRQKDILDKLGYNNWRKAGSK